MPKSLYNFCHMRKFNHHTIEAVVPNIVNEYASPKNTTILVLKTLYQGDVWNGVNKSNYYQVKEELANHLIEEFMIVTNCLVALRLLKTYPCSPILR